MTFEFLLTRRRKARARASTLLLLASLAGCASDAARVPELDEAEPEEPLGIETPTDAGRASDARAPSASAPDAGAPHAGGSDAGGSDAGGSDAGAPDGSAPDAGTATDAGDPELEALRQQCVDEINRYRATVGAAPLARATDREACSDRGAQLDGDTGRAHGSAGAGGRQGSNGYCPAGAQNTCPNWPVGGRSGNRTVADALVGCLKMMWDEGKPPTASCTGSCFQQHGHYLNMSAPGTKRVACGFYRTKNGSYWMNQNFW